MRDRCLVREFAYRLGCFANSETMGGAGLGPHETARPGAATSNAGRTSPPPCTGLPPARWVTRGRPGLRLLFLVLLRRWAVRFCQVSHHRPGRGPVADVVGIGGGVVSGSFTEP